MTFLSSVPARVGCRPSPPSRVKRQPINGGVNSREKVSRIGLLSIVLVLYSGITVGLILWNQSSSSPEVVKPEKPGDWVDDGHLDGEKGTSQWNSDHRRRTEKAGGGSNVPSFKIGNEGTVGGSLDGSASGEAKGGPSVTDEVRGDQRPGDVLLGQTVSTIFLFKYEVNCCETSSFIDAPAPLLYSVRGRTSPTSYPYLFHRF